MNGRCEKSSSLILEVYYFKKDAVEQYNCPSKKTIVNYNFISLTIFYYSPKLWYHETLKKPWCNTENYETGKKLFYYTKKTEIFEQIERQNFDLLLENCDTIPKTIVPERNLWRFDLLWKKIWYL